MSLNSRRTIRSTPKEKRALENIEIIKEMHLTDLARCISFGLKSKYKSIEDFRRGFDNYCVKIFYFSLDQIGWQNWQVEELLNLVKKQHGIRIGK